MLKFYNDEGELRYVLLDEDESPREVTEITEDLLRQLGLTPKEEKEGKKKYELNGLSQDDLKHVKEG